MRGYCAAELKHNPLVHVKFLAYLQGLYVFFFLSFFNFISARREQVPVEAGGNKGNSSQ